MTVPWVRLFWPLADVAGMRRVVLPGETVEDVLAAACARFGDGFTRHLRHCRVWVNGDSAPPDRRLDDGDDVALLPPVSGGSCPPGDPAIAEPPHRLRTRSPWMQLVAGQQAQRVGNHVDHCTEALDRRHR